MGHDGMEMPESSDYENSDSEAPRVQYWLRVSPQAQHHTENLRLMHQSQRNPEGAQRVPGKRIYTPQSGGDMSERPRAHLLKEKLNKNKEKTEL